MSTPHSITDGVTENSAEVINRAIRVFLDTTSGVTNPTTIIPSTGSVTERSGSVTLGGTSQQMMAANTSRKYLLIQNPSTTAGQNIATAETLFVRFGSTAATVNTGTSFEIVSGASLVMEGSFVSTQAVQVIAATTAHKWLAVEG